MLGRRQCWDADNSVRFGLSAITNKGGAQVNLPAMLFVLLLLAALWWLLRLRRTSGKKADDPKAVRHSGTRKSDYHAVSIKTGKRACDPAKNMVGRRYLATAAPKLPLAGCTLLDCSCRFVHHQDRRANRDRRSPFAPGGHGSSTGAFQTEQRAGSDRRKNDDDDEF